MSRSAGTSHVNGPSLAAAGEVLAMGDQPLMQLTGERWDAVHIRTTAKSMASIAKVPV
jgi:hypothetical protein